MTLLGSGVLLGMGGESYALSDGCRAIEQGCSGELKSYRALRTIALMNQPSRRSLLMGAAAFAAASALPGWYLEEVLAQARAADAPPRSSNDTPTFMLVGGGGRGRAIAREAQRFA